MGTSWAHGGRDRWSSLESSVTGGTPPGLVRSSSFDPFFRTAPRHPPRTIRPAPFFADAHYTVATALLTGYFDGNVTPLRVMTAETFIPEPGSEVLTLAAGLGLFLATRSRKP